MRLPALPLLSEVHVARPARPLTDRWQRVPVAPRGTTLLGISFRPLQAAALGMDEQATLRMLLAYPFQLVRLGAYWSQIESAPDQFCPDDLDWQLDEAERAGKQIILNVGAVKTFGYPECFVPPHLLEPPLREGSLITPATHSRLLHAAIAFITRLIERYRERKAIVAWQVEHDAADPLGMEHSWRLAASFIQEEVAAARKADPTRPILLNGFLPTSLPVRLQQWWRTRDQGDSLAVAQRLADIVGVDYYPRHALVRLGGRTIYLDGGSGSGHRQRQQQLLAWAAGNGHRLMISEGQAEPWETVTTPPNPPDMEMYSCLPEQVIENYNRCMRWNQEAASHYGLSPSASAPRAPAYVGTLPLYAYLFWGAEYWVLRAASGDPRYLRAFARILERA